MPDRPPIPPVDISGSKDMQLSKQVLNMINGLGETNANGEVTPSGREYLFSKHPDDFEYYAVAFELIDSANRTVEFFSFPVLPDHIRDSSHPINSIKKTMSGVVVTNNPTFPSKEIKMSGNFGRKFRQLRADTSITNKRIEKDVVLTGGQVNNNNSNNATFDNKQAVTETEVVVGLEFDPEWKTGYASTKILEKMLVLANKMDNNKGAHKLFFYNLAFNESMLVEVMNYDFFMSKDLNRIWQYDLTLKALGPALAFNQNARKSRQRLLDTNKIINGGGVTSKKAEDALKTKEGQKGLKSKLNKLYETEVGKRVYQVATAYQPDILRTALQLAENPTTINYFLPNVGNNILNTGNIF